MMKYVTLIAGAVCLVIGCAHSSRALAQPIEQPKSFPVAKVKFEQNATDGDVEVVFEISARREGLTKLIVASPDGLMVIDFTSAKSKPVASGIRQFIFESPEPTDTAALKAAFPEGVYTFEGQTESGQKLQGEAKLSHKLPATTRVKFPQKDAQDIPTKNMTITWEPVHDAVAYLIELEQEESNTTITASLPAPATTFAVPEGFLRPGMEYTLGVGTVSKAGNISFVEMDFTTAAAP
jgi:hypothetical protein